MASFNRITRSFLALLLVTLTACGGVSPSLPTVQAAPPAPSFTPPNTEQAPCSNGCIAMQSPGKFVELRYGPVSLSAQAGFQTTLPSAMHVAHLDAWIGTQSGTQYESDSRLQIIWPDGSYAEWKVQWDKHQDVVGDRQRNFPVSLDLPAGTTLVVYTTGAGVLPGGCPNGCGFDTTWSLEAY